jgi:hypothetical protein
MQSVHPCQNAQLYPQKFSLTEIPPVPILRP